MSWTAPNAGGCRKREGEGVRVDRHALECARAGSLRTGTLDGRSVVRGAPSLERFARLLDRVAVAAQKWEGERLNPEAVRVAWGEPEPVPRGRKGSRGIAGRAPRHGQMAPEY